MDDVTMNTVGLKKCPFCGGEPALEVINHRIGYGEYERTETYHAVLCKKCGSSGRKIHQKALIDFTSNTVSDFRNNPILRAKVEDEYDHYVQQSKDMAVTAWNVRV